MAGGLLGIGALAFFPGLWLYGAYPYHFDHPYGFRNDSANKNETLPVVCLCQQYNPCGCGENTDDDYIQSIVGDGSYSGLNKSVVTVAQVNGTKTLVLNGTLPNGTDFVPDDGSAPSSSAGQIILQSGGWWAFLAVVAATVLTMGV